MNLHDHVRWVHDCVVWDRKMSEHHYPVLPLAELRAWLEHANYQSSGNRPVSELLAELDAITKPKEG